MSTTQRVKWIDHKGKKVLSADYSGLDGQDVLDVFNEGKMHMINEGANVLSLGIFTGTKIDGDYIAEAKKAGTELDKMMKKTAVVGMTGLQKIFFNGYVRFTGQRDKSRLFDTLEQSLDWLVED